MIGYKEIEGMFPNLKHVQEGKNIIYVNQQTGKVLSRREALNLYTKGKVSNTSFSQKED